MPASADWKGALLTGKKETVEAVLRLDKMLHAFMFSLSGLPIIYSGDEIAAMDDYTYHEDPLKQEDSRYLHRGNMDWEKAERRQNHETPEGQIFNAVSSTDNHFYRD